MKQFRLDSSQYTGLAVEPMAELQQKHPEKRFVEYDGRDFPFQNHEFDWVFSNAVIEHVGEEEQQIYFVNEMLRVSRNVFFTTPNKFFPVESHTNVVIKHWNDEKFYDWCDETNNYFGRDNLILLSYKKLRHKPLPARNL